MTDEAADELAKLLVKLAGGGNLKEAANTLRNAPNASSSQQRVSGEGKLQHSTFSSVSQLVQHYHDKQRQDRTSKAKPSSASSKADTGRKVSAKMFSLNFAEYRRIGRFGYRMVPPGKVQIPGFTDKDTHKEVIMKGAKGLGIDSPVHQLSLLISNCLVKDVSLPSGKSWTLGNYTAEFGGPQARGKRTFGIFVPFTERDERYGIDDDYEVQATPDRAHDDDDDDLELPEGPITGQISKLPKRTHPADDTISTGSSTTDSTAKRPKLSPLTGLGTTQDNPIHIDSTNAGKLEVVINSSNLGIYQPVSNGKVIPGVTVVGTIGVWRLLCSDFSTTQQEILARMEDCAWNIQPEKENFILTELSIGKTLYLKTMTDYNQRETEIGNLKYYLKEKRLIHSPVTSIVEKSPIPLLVVSPNHGKVEYKWEYKSHYTDKWTKVEVPPYTCLLYVDTPRKYRCVVNEESIMFDVKATCKGKDKKCTEDEMAVSYDEIEFKELIGQGCFGAVYRGRYRNEDVAVKKIKPPPGVSKDVITASSREIAALKLLHHPNIVSLIGYTINKATNELIIIMNLIEGKNLHQLIFGNFLYLSIKLTEGRCNAIANDIAAGLQYMHTRTPPIIHRDIKPLNVMVRHDLQCACICDLGIAKLKDSANCTMTQQNIVGTYAYMAPEMFTPGLRNTPVDIYSLGCTYIELFGKRKVWPGLHTGAEIMQKVCGSFTSPPVMPRTDHLQPHQQQLCYDCCQLDHNKRPNIDTVLQTLTKNFKY